jgi:hypothetical protein
MTKAPICFILMPFGTKASVDGSMINFDRVYHDLIAPAVRDAGVVRKNSVQRFRRNVTLLHSNRLTSDASIFGFL